MKKWLIYKYTNKINGKVYIGQTSSNMKRRSSGDSLIGYKNCTYFWYAICKYGPENFSKEIIQDNISSQQEANDLEVFFISKYKSNNYLYGYNLKEGGNSNSYFAKRVYQYDLKGNYIKEYSSAFEAQEETNIHMTSISAVCNKRRKTAGGYYWSHKKMSKAIVDTFDTKNLKVYKYDLKGNFVDSYDNAGMLNIEFNCDYAAHRVIESCQKESGQNFGFQWRFYQSENIGDYSKHTLSKRHQGVYKYSLEGDFICFYKTNEIAAVENNIKNRSSISACCNGRSYQSGGFQWSYEKFDNIGSYFEKTSNTSQLKVS